MADAPPPKPETTDVEPAKKKKPPMMIIGAVVGVMVVEAAGVYFLVSKFNKGPEQAAAKIHGAEPAAEEGGHGEAAAGGHGGGEKAGGEHGAADAAPKDPESSIEVPLVSDKFQNMTAGVAWIWDAEIVVQIKAKNEKMIAETLKARDAEIKEGISTIFRKASLNQLKEPGLETLNRLVLAFVNKIVEPDADGNSRVLRVLIPKCRGFATD